MSADWSKVLELFGRVGQRVTYDHQAFETLWREFRQQVEQSRHADKLLPLVEYLEQPSSTSGLTLSMLGITQLLAQLEWPPALNAARERLVDALETLILQMGSRRVSNIASQLESELGSPFHQMVAVLDNSRALLALPCHLYDIHHVAILCNIGLQRSLEQLRDVLAATREPSQALSDARISFLYAHSSETRQRLDRSRASGQVGSRIPDGTSGSHYTGRTLHACSCPRIAGHSARTRPSRSPA